MHIKRKEDCKGLHSAHGEIVYEMIGKAAGSGELHSVAHIEMPPGKASRPHYHPVAEESYYILSGTARMVIDDETVIMSPGQAVAISPNEVHRIYNDGPETLHFLAICAPAWTPDNSIYTD